MAGSDCWEPQCRSNQPGRDSEDDASFLAAEPVELPMDNIGRDWEEPSNYLVDRIVGEHRIFISVSIGIRHAGRATVIVGKGFGNHGGGWRRRSDIGDLRALHNDIVVSSRICRGRRSRIVARRPTTRRRVTQANGTAVDHTTCYDMV